MGHNSKSILAPGHQHLLRQQTVQGRALEEDSWTQKHKNLVMRVLFVRRDAVCDISYVET